MIKLLLTIVMVTIILVLFIDLLNRRGVENLRRRGLYPLEGLETHADVERLVRMKRKIQAIKIYRTLHKVDLKTAKKAVDELAEKIEKERG